MAITDANRSDQPMQGSVTILIPSDQSISTLFLRKENNGSRSRAISNPTIHYFLEEIPDNLSSVIAVRLVGSSKENIKNIGLKKSFGESFSFIISDFILFYFSFYLTQEILIFRHFSSPANESAEFHDLFRDFIKPLNNSKIFMTFAIKT